MKNVRLGLFIVIGAVILVFLIFKMGSKSRLFQGRKKISVIFKDSKGLKKGNDVRFSGVNIGAVYDIMIENDSTVRVVMAIDDKTSEFIKKDSKATVSSEGLVGSKFVGISAGTSNSPSVHEGDQIEAGDSFEIEEILNSFSQVSQNADQITSRLNQLTENIANGQGPIGMLLADSMLQNKINNIASALEATSYKTNQLAGDMRVLPDQVELVGQKLRNITDSFQVANSNLIDATENLSLFSQNLNNDSTTIGKLVGDTIMARNIETTIDEVKNTAGDVKTTSTKVRSNLFIRLFGTGGG